MSRSNAPLTISVHSSGSSCSAAAVDPWMSANNIVTVRRSPAIEWLLRAACSFAISSLGTYRARSCSGRAGAFEPSGAPHFEQKELPAVYGVEQTGQVETREVPQFEQKEASSLFECPQVGHCIAVSFQPFADRSLIDPVGDHHGPSHKPQYEQTNVKRFHGSSLCEPQTSLGGGG